MWWISKVLLPVCISFHTLSRSQTRTHNSLTSYAYTHSHRKFNLFRTNLCTCTHTGNQSYLLSADVSSVNGSALWLWNSQVHTQTTALTHKRTHTLTRTQTKTQTHAHLLAPHTHRHTHTYFLLTQVRLHIYQTTTLTHTHTPQLHSLIRENNRISHTHSFSCMCVNVCFVHRFVRGVGSKSSLQPSLVLFQYSVSLPLSPVVACRPHTFTFTSLRMLSPLRLCSSMIKISLDILRYALLFYILPIILFSSISFFVLP